MMAGFVAAMLLAGLGFLVGCQDQSALDKLSTAESSDPDAMQSGEVSGLNYTPYYIHTFGITGANGITGGGPNIQPARPGNMPSGGGGGMCCATFPAKWRPGLRVTIHWIANKKLDGVAWGSWYKAEAGIPEYGPHAGNLFAVFLPDDKVKIMVQDGNANGHNDLGVRPEDNDPYVAVGTIDEDANREEEESRLKAYGKIIKADPTVGGLRK